MAQERSAETSSKSGLKSIFGNLVHLVGGKSAAAVFSLIYLVIVTHSLGAKDYGLLSLVNAYALLMGSLVAFSGFHGVVRYGAIAWEDGDYARLARVIRFMAVVELGFGALAIVVAAVLVPLVGPQLGWSEDLVWIGTVYSLAVTGTVRATPQGLLQIARRFDLIGIHQAIMPFMRLFGSMLVWLVGGGLMDFIAVWLVSAIIEGLSMWLLGIHVWRRLNLRQGMFGPWRIGPGKEEGFIRFITITNFDLTLRELTPNLAPLTVGWFLGPAAAGLLALVQRVTLLLQQPAVLLSQASYVVLARQAARREFVALRSTVWRAAAIAGLIATPVVFVLTVMGGRVLTLVGGAAFSGGGTLLVIVAISRMAALGTTPIAAGLTALGRPQRSLIVGLGTNLGLYPLLPLLIGLMGVNGAGWHALIQTFIGFAVLAAFFFSDSLKN